MKFKPIPEQFSKRFITYEAMYDMLMIKLAVIHPTKTHEELNYLAGALAVMITDGEIKND